MDNTSNGNGFGEEPTIAEWALPPVGEAAPILVRQMTSDKFAFGHDVLRWVISLGEQNIRGYVAGELTVFPVCIWTGFDSPTPTSVHYVRLGGDDFDGMDEHFNSSNPLHLQLVELNQWWQETGRDLYMTS